MYCNSFFNELHSSQRSFSRFYFWIGNPSTVLVPCRGIAELQVIVKVPHLADTVRLDTCGSSHVTWGQCVSLVSGQIARPNCVSFLVWSDKGNFQKLVHTASTTEQNGRINSEKHSKFDGLLSFLLLCQARKRIFSGRDGSLKRDCCRTKRWPNMFKRLLNVFLVTRSC